MILFILLLALFLSFFIHIHEWVLQWRGLNHQEESASLPLKSVFRSFTFNQSGNLKGWEDKIFHGKSKYTIGFEGDNGFVKGHSNKTSSAIFYRVKFDPSRYPILAWKWRAGKFPNKGNAADPKSKDDFSARVYVIFISRFFTNYRCIEYVWDESVKEGSVLKSPYSAQIKHLVVQTGHTQDWISEKQNIVQDYKKLFGEKPNMKAAAIALMTDADGSQSEAEGYFDDIQIGRDE